MMIATIPRDHAKMENVNVNQAGNYKTAMVFYFLFTIGNSKIMLTGRVG